MKQFHFLCLWFCLTSALALFVGCGGEKVPEGMPPLVKFSLTITQDGKALDGAAVSFQTSSHSYKVDGTTNSSGVVQLLTSGKFKGAPEGEYQVEVKKEIATESKFGNDAPVNPDARAKWDANRLGEYRPTHSYVDKKFGNFETSGLTVQIVKGGSASLEVGSAVDDIIIPKGSSPNPSGDAEAMATDAGE